MIIRAKAALKNLNVKKGCRVYLHCDAPPGSGLGSSSTLVVAMVGAIIEWQNITMDNYEISERAIQIERRDLGIAGGYQDQFSSCFGGFNFIEFYKDTVIVNPLRIPEYLMNELEYNLVLCYTGGGGYILLYCPYEKKHKVSERLEALGGQVINWGFDLNGLQKWSLDGRKGENEKFYKREYINEHTA